MILLLNQVEFALQACLDGAVYGVTTDCNRCDQLFNSCLQGKLVDLLEIKQDLIERELGYTVTERYIVEDLKWDGTAQKRVLSYPGISAINVIEEAVYQFDLPVNPYVLEDLEIQSNDDYCFVVLDKTIVKNPSDIKLWNDLDRIILKHEEYSIRRDENGDWIYPLGKPYGTAPCVTEDVLKATHCNYVFVDVPIDEDCDDLTATYYGTTDQIPVYKIENIDEETNRYWFYIWSLKDSAFEYADFSIGEFYKLYENISFYCFSDIEQLPSVLKVDQCSCPTREFLTDTKIQIDILNANEALVYFQRSQTICDCSAVVSVRIYYKVDPELLPYYNRNAILNALTYEVAANLPIKTCNCPAFGSSAENNNFVSTAQMPYDKIKINPVTGTEVIELQYGKMYGHLVYVDEVKKLKKWQKISFL